MSKFKKILLIVVVAVISLGIAGCKEEGNPDGDHPTTKALTGEHPIDRLDGNDHPRH